MQVVRQIHRRIYDKRQYATSASLQITKTEYPNVSAALENLGTAVRAAGPIDIKTGHLIQLAGAAGIRSEESVHSHTLHAIEAGATPEEIKHAVLLLTSTVGFPSVAAALSWIDEELERS